jgi:hypothetical protein
MTCAAAAAGWHAHLATTWQHEFTSTLALLQLLVKKSGRTQYSGMPETLLLQLLLQWQLLLICAVQHTWLSAFISRSRSPVKSTFSRPANGRLGLGMSAAAAAAANAASYTPLTSSCSFC